MHPRILKMKMEQATDSAFESLNRINMRHGAPAVERPFHRDLDMQFLFTIEAFAELAKAADEAHLTLKQKEDGADRCPDTRVRAKK